MALQPIRNNDCIFPHIHVQISLPSTLAVGVGRSPARPWTIQVSAVDPSFRALSGRLKFTVRRHKFNKDSLPASTLAVGDQGQWTIKVSADGRH